MSEKPKTIMDVIKSSGKDLVTAPIVAGSLLGSALPPPSADSVKAAQATRSNPYLPLGEPSAGDVIRAASSEARAASKTD